MRSGQGGSQSRGRNSRGGSTRTGSRSGGGKRGGNRSRTSGSERDSERGGRSSQKRDLVRKPGGAAYAKRRDDGRFKEMDDVGRSQRRDRRTDAEREVEPGYGDQGDQE